MQGVSHMRTSSIFSHKMSNMEFRSSEIVSKIFEGYPERVRCKMNNLRDMVISVAESIHNLEVLEETTKWGEPSYITKRGSTLRMDWKAKRPDQYAIYFSCSTRLVSTFKILYGDMLTYEGKRAVTFQIDRPIPTEIVRHLIKLTLQYHDLKKMPLLGE